MANEGTKTGTLNWKKGDRKISFGSQGEKFDVTGNDYIARTQVLSTSEEALDLGEITTPGMCMFRNNSTTTGENISIRPATGAANMIKLLPGEEAGPFRLEATAPFAIAAAGTPELEYVIIEE